MSGVQSHELPQLLTLDKSINYQALRARLLTAGAAITEIRWRRGVTKLEKRDVRHEQK